MKILATIDVCKALKCATDTRVRLALYGAHTTGLYRPLSEICSELERRLFNHPTRKKHESAVPS